MPQKERTVIISNHEKRLQPTLKAYTKLFPDSENYNTLTLLANLVSDIILFATDIGLNSFAIIAEGQKRAKRVLQHPPDGNADDPASWSPGEKRYLMSINTAEKTFWMSSESKSRTDAEFIIEGIRAAKGYTYRTFKNRKDAVAHAAKLGLKLSE